MCIPELRKKFMDACSKFLKVASAGKRNIWNFFMEIRSGAGRCKNVSVLRSYADKAEALKIRLLNEDVEKYVNQLKKSLLAELDVNDILNVEF